MLAAPWGARLAHRLSRAVLTRIFGGFLIIMAVLMLMELQS